MTTDSALRELVSEWRERADELGDARDPIALTHQLKLRDCANELEIVILTAAGDQQPAPAGMVLVPRVMTLAMEDAWFDAKRHDENGELNFQLPYSAMLAAAPAAQVAEPVQTVCCGKGCWCWFDSGVIVSSQCRVCQSKHGAWPPYAAAPAVVVDEASVCASCEPDGVYATDGSGPYDCYACGKKVAVIVIDEAMVNRAYDLIVTKTERRRPRIYLVTRDMVAAAIAAALGQVKANG